MASWVGDYRAVSGISETCILRYGCGWMVYMYHVCGHARVLCLAYLLYGYLYRCISICTYEAHTKRRFYTGLYSYWDLSHNRTLSDALTFKSERSVKPFSRVLYSG